MTSPAPSTLGVDELDLPPETAPDDDRQPAPNPPRKVSRQTALENVSQPTHEVTDDTTAGTLVGPGGEVGGHTLSALLALHPFMRFFCWLAHQQFPAHHRSSTRVASMRTSSPRLYWVCVSLDVLVSLVAVVLLLAAAAVVLYKTIWLGGLPAGKP